MNKPRKLRGNPCTECGGPCLCYDTLPAKNGDSIRYLKCSSCGANFKALIPEVKLILTRKGKKVPKLGGVMTPATDSKSEKIKEKPINRKTGRNHADPIKTRAKA